MTIPNDASQDNDIHCFKADQPCHTGLERLQSLNDIVTGPRTDRFAGISVAVNLNDEAEWSLIQLKSSAMIQALTLKILTLNIDYRNQRNKFETKPMFGLYLM